MNLWGLFNSLLKVTLEPRVRTGLLPGERALRLSCMKDNGFKWLPRLDTSWHWKPHFTPCVNSNALFMGIYYVEADSQHKGDKVGPYWMASCSVRNKQGLHPAHSSWHTSPSFPAKSALPGTRQWLSSTYNAILMKLKKIKSPYKISKCNISCKVLSFPRDSMKNIVCTRWSLKGNL